MTEESEPVTDRRSLLRLGSTALAAAVAGCEWGGGEETPTGRPPETTADGPGPETASPGTDREPSIPYSERFENVVDVVADGGADPNAESSIRAILDEHAGDDTLLYFPPGRYLLDDIWVLESFQNFGMVGRDAVFVPKSGYNDYLLILGLPDRGSTGLIVDGLTFDFREPDTHPRPIQVQMADDFLVRDVSARGTSGTARFDVTTPEGSGRVVGLDMPDGGFDPSPVGILVGPENAGQLTFENCRLKGFKSNGLYASPSNGPVHVIGGLYANCGIANVRVSSPTIVRGVTVRCNRSPDGWRNMRGIRLRHGETGLIEDCTIEMSDVTYSGGAIVLGRLMETATVRNVDIELSADEVPAINAKSPTKTTSASGIAFENVTVSGAAATGDTVTIADRDGCELRNVDIQQTGANRNGIHLIRAAETSLRNATIDVTGEPLVLEQSELMREAVSIP